MKTIALAIVATLLSTAAFADSQCYRRNNRTYCYGDEGFSAHYQTRQGYIYSPQTGKSYNRSGNTLSGSDGSVRTKRGSDVWTSKPGAFDDNDVVVDDLFGDGGGAFD